MAKITYINQDGTRHVIDVPTGQSVKDGAVNGLVRGIIAECGGACACATCHVYVDHDWWNKTGGPAALETEMLEFVYDVKATSRLSCQIEVTDDLDGLVVQIPERQQ